MDDLTALSETAGRPKRRADEALGPEASSDLLTPAPYPQGLPSLQGAGSNLSTGVSPYGMGSTSPGPSYVPGYEWWPQLVGPGISQPYQPEAASYSADPLVTPYTGMPNSLFTFDPTHMSADFMQDVQQGGPGPSTMQHYSQHPNHQQQPPHR